ncbi:hypothetical protein [Salinisphaera sp. LB1]|uniref:hypothetical protein n=1 Tax=Salinisphaera sp. LB1 TaxID=2183911 RepID=UPI000D70833D|nr:hypothetical protein [Salinisphaera sp. LB1]AWN16577.1 hypothetical protein SALB1_2379 [Salinisphaera sp. LB1]
MGRARPESQGRRGWAWWPVALAAAFLVPPVAGLVLIARFFGGLGPGLWLMAGVVFLFAVTLVVGLARAERAAPKSRR